MKSVQYFGILSFMLVISCGIFSQTKTIPIVTQNGDSLNLNYRCTYRLVVDGKDQGEMNFTKSSVVLPYPDSLLKVEINGGLVQRYYNEFTPTNVDTLGEIEVFWSNIRSTKTPRFFRQDIANDDLSIKDSLDWFLPWLEMDKRVTGYQIEVKNAGRLKASHKRRIRKIHAEIDAFLGRTSELIFTNVPYITTDEDAFNSGTKITSDFIDDQNTDYMKTLAQGYSIAMVLIIQWGDD